MVGYRANFRLENGMGVAGSLYRVKAGKNTAKPDDGVTTARPARQGISNGIERGKARFTDLGCFEVSLERGF